ncbi:hypothetical protein FA13DRAFT_1819104 [Coprinellus micaceus]|uniref:Uncharacterized protein n=1 Tax=Coprinellus micaceus TaxID=71717 RepID=A0A4Y7SJV5_COPMI|nr:hypothetical protein FA13DRAFT_1819104 [Coprinellus micaceus]
MSSSPAQQEDGTRVPGCVVFEYRGRRLVTAPSPFTPDAEPEARRRFPEIPASAPIKFYATEIAGFDKVRIVPSAWDKLIPVLGYVLIESEGENPPPSSAPPPPTKPQPGIVHPQCMVMTFQGESVIVGKPVSTGTEDPGRLLSRIAVEQFPAINQPPLEGTQNFFATDMAGMVGQQVEISLDAWKTLLPGIRSVVIDTIKRPPVSPPAAGRSGVHFRDGGLDIGSTGEENGEA